MKYVLTYGIACVKETEGNRELITEIPSVTSSIEEANRLIRLCNEGNLNPDHLKNIVEDFVEAN